LICSGRSQILWPRVAGPIAHSENGGGTRKNMILPPEQAIGILDDDRVCQRRTQNAYSNEARRRIVPMKKEIPPDRRLSSLHEQKASGDVCRNPASRVGISRVQQVLRGHKCGKVIGSTCRRISYSTMWKRCFLIGGVSIFGGSAICFCLLGKE